MGNGNLTALLIAEKPDLMRQIETVYNLHSDEIPYGVAFMSQRGHLIALKEPGEMDEDLKTWSWETLPIVPEEHGGWQYKVIDEKKVGNYLTPKERYEMIRKELKSGRYDFVINAGDPDQEGQLLIWETLTKAGNTLPVKRFWTNDLTENAILTALKELRDDSEPALRNLLDAAYGRQHSDYRFGMNVSRAATLKMNTKVACGRCETWIQAVVVKREEEIRNFRPETVYGLKAVYEGGFEGTLFEASRMSRDKEETDEDKKGGTVWFSSKAEAEELSRKLGREGTVTAALRKRTESYAPKLFKLATLQIAAGKLGYNDAETLSIIQDLYEKKYVSYPRTDCEYLSSKEDFSGILKAARSVPDLVPFADRISADDIDKVRRSKKWINDKALEDSGHSALRPTTLVPDFGRFSKEEQDIYRLICRQFIAIFLAPLVQDKAQIIIDIDGRTFRSSGSVLVSPGYTEIFGKTFTDNAVPDLKEGDKIRAEEFAVTEKTTTCPKRFTSPDLIAVCENPAKYLDDKSLKALGKRLHVGTPATRSAIIRKLIDNHGYLAEEKEGKKICIRPTPKGEAIIKNLGDCPICKVDMTGHWEEMLEDIRTGRLSLADFEDSMRNDVVKIINDIRTRDMASLGDRKPRAKPVGICPKCGKELVESEKGFSCRGYRRDGTGCNIKLWKEKFGASFSLEDFLTLLDGKPVVKDVRYSGKSEQGAELVYDFTANDIRFRDDEDMPVGKCPKCGKEVTASARYFSCQGCGIRTSRIVCGAVLSDGQILELLGGGDVTAECSKDGRSWKQKLRLDRKEKKIAFAVDETDIKCPACRKAKMTERDFGYKCPKCGLTVWKTVAGKTLTEEELTELLTNGETGPVSGLKKKDGTPFKSDPVLVVDRRKKQVVFDFRQKNN